MGSYTTFAYDIEEDHQANLLDFQWRVIPEAEYDERRDDEGYTFRENLKDGCLEVEPVNCTIDRTVIKNLYVGDPEDLPGLYVNFFYYEGELNIDGRIYYPVLEDDELTCTTGSDIDLNEDEERYFTELVREALKGYEDIVQDNE